MSVKGIDVSEWQGDIDWQKVKTTGIKFAMLRGGFGRVKTQIDKKFEQNYKNAKAAGMPIGVYHYSYAASPEEAIQEAKFVISYLKGKTFEYPIAFDIEDEVQAKLNTTQRTEIAKAFCEAMENAGYYVVIYANKYWFENCLNMNKLSVYDIWLAQWADKPTYGGNFGMWQYSDVGKVNGINGYVDLDRAYKDYPSIIKAAGLNGFKKPTAKPKETMLYTVKSGESLKEIAEKNKTTVQALAAKNPDMKLTAQRLKI